MTTNVHAMIAALTPDNMATEINTLYAKYKDARASWEAEMLEISDYKYATSTNTTGVKDAGFNNSTTIPKLSQIAMNLQANYSAHLFSNPKWAQFEAFDDAAANIESRRIVEAYVRTKLHRKDYEGVFNKLLIDWIDTGVCFAQQRYITETYEDTNGHTKMLYQGCVLERISPEDIVFDVTATTFAKAAKVVRKTYSLGDIRAEIDENPDTPFTHALLEDMRVTRQNVRSAGRLGSSRGIDWKQQSLSRAGLGSLMEYMKGDIVEVLEFYGDFYSMETGEFLKNHKIIVADKRKVIFAEPIRSRNGSQRIYMAGWEDRPDSLMAMSPLARLVGMQYKLDKLENQRADAFDRIIHPITVERGDVEFHGTRGAPGGRYITDEEGDVREMRPDTTVLNADFQMQNSMAIMEEMAGSPRNSSGVKTPGEKTKFEVQFLENGANRIFRTKTNKFEKEMIEAVLNDMIEIAMDNMGETDLVSTEGTEFKTQEFLSVSKSDLNISGKLRARGSRMFAEKANALQNLLGVFNTPAFQLLAPHISRKKLSAAVEYLADLEELDLFTPNIGVQEDAETQQMANQAQQSTSEIDAVNADEPIVDDEDIEQVETLKIITSLEKIQKLTIEEKRSTAAAFNNAEGVIGCLTDYLEYELHQLDKALANPEKLYKESKSDTYVAFKLAERARITKLLVLLTNKIEILDDDQSKDV